MNELGKNSIAEDVSTNKIECFVDALEAEMGSDPDKSEASDFMDAIGNDNVSSLSKYAICTNFAYSNEYKEQRDREFAECAISAKQLFNQVVVENWSNLPIEQREYISKEYADEVARAFDLNNYQVSFVNLPDDAYGMANNDGNVYLNTKLLSGVESPLAIVDTIAHELRHIYQYESIEGRHNVPYDVQREWETALKIYTTKEPWAFDPFGYRYNPLEVDANNAGMAVVSELTTEILNDKYL